MDAGSAGTSLPAMKVAPAVKAPSAPAPATPVSGPRSPGTKAGSRPPASGSAAQKPDHLTPINPDDIYGP
jgi:hypothetical protein